MKDKGIAKKRTPFGSIRAMSSATESWRQLVQCRVGGRADILFGVVLYMFPFPNLIVGLGFSFIHNTCCVYVCSSDECYGPADLGGVAIVAVVSLIL